VPDSRLGSRIERCSLKVGVLGKAIARIKQGGAVAGIGGHSIEVVKACEREKVAPDFYMKTFNSKRYWSAGSMPRHDSVWERRRKKPRRSWRRWGGYGRFV